MFDLFEHAKKISYDVTTTSNFGLSCRNFGTNSEHSPYCCLPKLRIGSVLQRLLFPMSVVDVDPAHIEISNDVPILTTASPENSRSTVTHVYHQNTITYITTTFSSGAHFRSSRCQCRKVDNGATIRQGPVPYKTSSTETTSSNRISNYLQPSPSQH